MTWPLFQHNWLTTVRTCALIPLLVPIWLERPLRDEDVVVAVPSVVDEHAVRFQAEGVPQVLEPFRTELLQDLAATGHRAAVPALLTAATEGATDILQLNALSQLSALPVTPRELQPIVRQHLARPQADFRYWACRLAARAELTEPDLANLTVLAVQDPEPRVRLAARTVLPQHAGAYPGHAAPWPWHPDDDLALRVAGWPTIAAARNAPTRAAEAHDQLRQNPSAAIRHAIWTAWVEHQPDVARTWWPDAAKDAHAAVRAAVAEHASVVGLDDPDHLAWLITAAQADRDAHVRMTAYEALAPAPPDKVWAAVKNGLADPVPFVRRAAEDATVAVGAHVPAAPAALMAHAAAAQPASPTRVHSLQALARLSADGIVTSGAIPELAPALLDIGATEKDAAVLVAALRLLKVWALPAGQSIAQQHARHEDPHVRTAAARLFGRVGDDTVYDTVALMIKDDSAEVRQAAIEAAGHSGDARFNHALLNILQTTAHDLAADRATAIWAAARLETINDDVIERIQHLASRPIASIAGEPIFDHDRVLASAILASAHMARRHSEWTGQFEQLRDLYERHIERAKQVTPGPPPRPLTSLLENAYLLQDLPRQTTAWVQDDLDIPGTAVSPRTRRMRYRAITSKQSSP